MADSEAKSNRRLHFGVRVTEAEEAYIEQLKTRLEPTLAPGSSVTDRVLLFTALERLAAHLAKLEKDRARRRD